MSLTDNHCCWCVPTLLLLVVTSTWIILSVYTSSSTQAETEQEDWKNDDTKVNNVTSTKPGSTVECVCPPPYVRVMEQCYFANSHHLLSWDESRQFCQDMGGDLAQPRHTNALLVYLLDNFGLEVKRWYLGGTDVDTEGDWLWVGGKPVNSRDWGHGEPSGGSEENCLEFCFVCFKTDVLNPFPALNDERCTTKLNFVCEYVMASCAIS